MKYLKRLAVFILCLRTKQLYHSLLQALGPSYDSIKFNKNKLCESIYLIMTL
jgi:hypothetical protein